MSIKRYCALLLCFLLCCQPVVAVAPAAANVLLQMLGIESIIIAGQSILGQNNSLATLQQAVQMQQKQVVRQQTTKVDWELLAHQQPWVRQIPRLINQQQLALSMSRHNSTLQVAPYELAVAIHNQMSSETKVSANSICQVGLKIHESTYSLCDAMAALQHSIQLQQEDAHANTYMACVHDAVLGLIHAHKAQSCGQQVYELLDLLAVVEQLEEQQHFIDRQTVDVAHQVRAVVETILAPYVNEHGALILAGSLATTEQLSAGLRLIVEDAKLQAFRTRTTIEDNFLASFSNALHKARTMGVQLHAGSCAEIRHVAGIFNKVKKNSFNQQLLLLRQQMQQGQTAQAKTLLTTIEHKYKYDQQYVYTAKQCFQALRNQEMRQHILPVYQHDPLWERLSRPEQIQIIENRHALQQVGTALTCRQQIKDLLIKEYGLTHVTREIDQFLYYLVDCRLAHERELELTIVSSLWFVKDKNPAIYNAFFLPNGLLRHSRVATTAFAHTFVMNTALSHDMQLLSSYFADKILLHHAHTTSLAQEGLAYIKHAQGCPEEAAAYLALSNLVCNALDGDAYAQAMLKNKQFLLHAAHTNKHQHEVDEVVLLLNEVVVHYAQEQGIEEHVVHELMQVNDTRTLRNGLRACFAHTAYAKTFVLNKAHSQEFQTELIATINELLSLKSKFPTQTEHVYRALRYCTYANEQPEEVQQYLTLAQGIARAITTNDPVYQQLLQEKDFLTEIVRSEEWQQNQERVQELAERIRDYESDRIFLAASQEGGDGGFYVSYGDGQKFFIPNFDPEDDKKREEIVEKLMKKTESNHSYETAKAGGRHAEHYQNYKSKSIGELRRGIRSYTRQITLHKDKIRHPKKHYSDFDKWPIDKQKNLIAVRWPGDIVRLTEQKDILENLLKELL